MNSNNLDKYFTWLPVVNTVEEHKDGDSSNETLLCKNRIRKSTKKLNKYLKTSRPKRYSDFVRCKKEILSKIRDDSDVTNESDLSDSDYKTFYDSFNMASAENSSVAIDELFVWSFVEKQGLKKEPEDVQQNSMWECNVDISVGGNHEQCDSVNKSNVSSKAPGALLIRKKLQSKRTQYNTRSFSLNNSVNKNSSSSNILMETPSNVVEKVNDSNTKTLSNNKLKNAKRNLKSAIENVSSQVSENSEANLSCDFIPEDFQAQSTQIFSDTFTVSSAKKNSRPRLSLKHSSNDAIYQPRDSGIEEDSRDENTTHQNTENNKETDLSSKSSESQNTPHKKQNVKIIGDQTLTKRYVIVPRKNGVLQPIVEEKHAPLSELNDKNNDSNLQSDNNSISDFKSIKSDNEEESNDKEKAKESSDEYYDVHDKNASSSEDESSLKNGNVETDEGGDQGSKHHCQKVQKELKRCTSPWVAKQYNDLRRLRLLDDSQDDSEAELNNDVSDPVEEQKVSIKSKKSSQSVETSSKSSNTKNNKKKLVINGTSIKNPDLELNKSEVSNNNFDENGITDANLIEGVKIEQENTVKSATLSKEKKKKKEKVVKNGVYPSSKLVTDDEEYCESDSIDNHRSSQKSKKFKQKKKKEKTNRTNSLGCKEDSCERETQHDLNGVVKSYKDSSQSNNNDKSNENIKKSYEEYDAVPDLQENSTKQKIQSDYDISEDSKTNADALSSNNNSSCKDSSALSIKDIVNSTQAKKNVVKNEIFTSSDDDKESEDEKAMSENQKKKLQNFKKLNLTASDDSSDSETDSENKNERTNEKIVEKSHESEDELDGREAKKTMLPDKESQGGESDNDDEGVPTLHAQKKLQQMKRLNFDDSSDSDDSEADTASTNKHKSQFVKPEITQEQSFDENSEAVRKVSSDEGSEREDVMPENQNKQLQNTKKPTLRFSDESSDSESECENVDPQSKAKSPRHESKRNSEINTRKSYESDANETDSREKKETVVSHKESQSDESDKENEVLPTQHAQKKIAQMKRLNFDDSSDSEESETEIISMNKHKSQFIQPEIVKEQIVDEKSEGASDDEELTMSENQKKQLNKMKKMDLMASDESEDSDEEDQTSKSKSRKLSEEEIKSEDSEDDDKTSSAAVQESHKKNKLSDSKKDSDSESVHYDSDNVDVKDHKVVIPEDLKNTNLLDDFNNSNIASFAASQDGGKSEPVFDKMDGNEDEEIDNVVPVEVSKRMQQLKRLNLYEDTDSSDSDESLRNNRNDKNTSQKSSNASRKERDDDSSDEKERINEEPSTSQSKVNETEVNDTKEDIDEDIAGGGELEEAVGGKNKNVIIPETQESFLSDDIQSQEMFSSLEDLTENPDPVPPMPQVALEKRTPAKPIREKITEIAQLVEQEELEKSYLDATMTLDEVSDDEEIFVIEVPKHILDNKIIGKKLVVTDSTLSIGNSHYEAVKKDAPSKMTCVLNSKKNKFKTVNIRPLLSIVARRKKIAEDFIENSETENRQEKSKTKRNKHYKKESDQESVNETEVKATLTKKSKSKKLKLPETIEHPAVEEGKHSKKKSAKNKKIDSNDATDDVEISKEKTGKAKISKALKRKLYASDHEIKDVGSPATDDSSVNTNSLLKKPKSSKKVKKNEAAGTASDEKIIGNELNNVNAENETESTPKHENNDDAEITEPSKSKTKIKKKSNKKAAQQETQEESNLKTAVNTLEDDEKMFENMFRDSFLVNVSTIEEEKPVKKKPKKRKNPNASSEDVKPEVKAKRKKKVEAEEVEESEVAVTKPKKSRKKPEKPKEEPASVQIMKFISDAFKSNGEKLNVSTSSNESRYGALDIERVSAKKNYSSSSSSDESEQKYSRPSFQIRNKSKEKELPESTASSCSTAVKKELKKEKDDKKKIKKILFDE